MDDPVAKFADYCVSFYGPSGLYPMASRERVVSIASGYASDLASNGKFCGDSIDREAVRDLIRDRKVEAI